MDNLDFGIAGTLILILIGFLGSIFKTFLVYIGAYHFSKMATPIAARKLNISKELNVTSKLHALSFLTAWLFIVPLTLEIVNLLPYIGRTSINNNVNIITFYDFYLIGLTLFTFDKDLNNVELKPFGKTVRNVLIYFSTNLILYIIFDILSRCCYSGELQTLQYLVIKPLIFGIVTIRLIKRNNISA